MDLEVREPVAMDQEELEPVAMDLEVREPVAMDQEELEPVAMDQEELELVLVVLVVMVQGDKHLETESLTNQAMALCWEEPAIDKVAQEGFLVQVQVQEVSLEVQEVQEVLLGRSKVQEVEPVGRLGVLAPVTAAWLVEATQDTPGMDRNLQHRRQPNMQPCKLYWELEATEVLAVRVNTVVEGGSEKPPNRM
ncbi:uncharacterized protein LOC142891921 isoform X2 [Nelusetta ayraudi]|uniref:uncharacterized protein LOC142891921 isoform X2 n=1 Tax=Nelusetta ayraudi TaxID=303726 RepID=UPI003F71F5CE